MNNLSYIAIGSNIEPRERHVATAINEIRKNFKIEKISNIYESKAWGVTDQGDFLNFCIEIKTDLNATDLLLKLQEIENKIGKIKRKHWGPREIDLDILFFNDEVIDDGNLKVPHPYIQERSFVLKPLKDIAPNFIHTKLNKTILELESKVDDSDLEIYKPIFRDLELVKDTLIMGIVNLTTDSFSNDGLLKNENYLNSLKEKVKEQLENGANIIDIGAESTKPGFKEVSQEDEEQIIVSAIKEIRKNYNCTISVDTRNYKTAESAIKNGANIINFVSGINDEKMFRVAASYDVPIVLMHNTSSLAKTNGEYFYDSSHKNVFVEVFKNLLELTNNAIKCGVSKEKIIIDPGIGFGKTVNENIELIRELHKLKELKLPILMGASRKSFIGKSLNLDVSERLEATIAVNTISQMYGAKILRVHDVKEASRASLITDIVLGNTNVFYK